MNKTSFAAGFSGWLLYVYGNLVEISYEEVKAVFNESKYQMSKYDLASYFIGCANARLKYKRRSPIPVEEKEELMNEMADCFSSYYGIE